MRVKQVRQSAGGIKNAFISAIFEALNSIRKIYDEPYIKTLNQDNIDITVFLFVSDANIAQHTTANDPIFL